MTEEFYKCKYKALRAGCLGMSQIYRRNRKEDLKDCQRIVALAARIINKEPAIDLAYQIRSIALETIRKYQ
jgi:hypothetical protein